MTDMAQPILITVKTRFLAEQSDMAQDKYVFAYTITLENRSAVTCQLIGRYWKITDADGEVKEVSGQGVVGEQPVLAPGDHYTYTSGSIFDTPTGTMEGHYQMQKDSGEMFDAPIPTFVLVPPHLLH